MHEDFDIKEACCWVVLFLIAAIVDSLLSRYLCVW